MRPLPKLAASAAVGTGAAVTGYYGVLFGESLLARKAIGMSDDRPPSADGVYGDDLPGRPIRCILLGDSALVGYGMDSANDTPPALIGLGLSHVLDTPVDVHSMAVVGAKTSDLHEQVNRGLVHKPDIAVIVVGTNDVTHRLVASPPSARQLGATVRRLVAAGCEVVVGTCPDLGTIRPLPQPLRWVARRRSRDLARRQMVAVVAAGGRGVSLGDLLGPVFDEKYDLMFGADRFHPSATGYANMASVLVPSMVAAMRERAVEVQSVTQIHAEPTSDLMSLDQAADRAGRQSGTEVSQQGRWATVLRRRRAS
ncbi:SGNH/GDSL hydrolase family protein [Aeromicrobium sp.]|uniref:SGNH/GDSL hydrolase family protein n=1 Tax=Aeromicrobium sp. TaxID=1871063 RepID=UPI003C48AE4F